MLNLQLEPFPFAEKIADIQDALVVVGLMVLVEVVLVLVLALVVSCGGGGVS